MLDTDKIILTTDLKYKIESSISTILIDQFSTLKAQIDPKHERLNFACPYCGDSDTDTYKKRGNLYWSTLMFHCYNGGCSKPHTDLVTLLRDFDQKIGTLDDMNTVLDYIKAHKTVINKSSTTYLEFGVFQTLSDLSIDKSVLLRAIGASIITESSSIYAYMKSRLLHKNLQYFAYNYRKNQLVILNLHNDKVIGLQIRNMNSNYKNKYVSYTIEKIYRDILKEPQTVTDIENIEKINTLSIYFGIFEVDFTKPFTIFEGPMDHYLYPRNSIAISGADKNSNMFDENPNSRYLFDNDPVGIRVMKEKIKGNKNVFMWSKFLETFKLPNNKKIKDYNDLIIYCYRYKNKAFSKIEDYFSQNKLDMYYI